MRFQLKSLPRLILTGVGLTLMTLLLAPIILVRSMFPNSHYRTYRLGRAWNWAVAKFMGVTFSITGVEKVDPRESYIITPNHQSFADILALYVKLPVPFRWVIKKELLKIPIYGRALGATGAIALDRSDKQRSVSSLQEGIKGLARGFSLVIYPEGTRTPDGLLHPFKKGAFMMAVQTGIPILPVTCNGAFQILPKNTFTVRPGHVTLTVGDPIPTKGLTEKDVPALMERTWHAVNKYLNPNYDPFSRRSRSQAQSVADERQPSPSPDSGPQGS